PPYLKGIFNVRLVRFDVESEAPVRDVKGFCIEAAADEAGECLGEIHEDARTAYTGYADKAASEKKVLTDVFRKGDRWFRTGDLLRKDADGYFFFVDRIGDTFRWKGENVSTSEVASALLKAPGVEEANVYGVAVQGAEGRAGMAGLVVGDGFDVKAFSKQVFASLPAYAQPVFLRLLPHIETTGTFKYRKMDLVADGFDPEKVHDPLYVRDPEKGYVTLTKPVYDQLLAGEVRI
ncbi:MAG TPA: long-chain-acyl-CoA synthetase, partial [Polyangia bacterium]|nr:long-chain-acyl-CoA synthetase [Polyangia bacterium]